jgi:hypothetical protein
VVNPLFFPGGDIGRLAVCGTVNDLSMSGARPLYLSLALIIEEGLAVEDLENIMKSIRQAAMKPALLSPPEIPKWSIKAVPINFSSPQPEWESCRPVSPYKEPMRDPATRLF